MRRTSKTASLLDAANRALHNDWRESVLLFAPLHDPELADGYGPKPGTPRPPHQR